MTENKQLSPGKAALIQWMRDMQFSMTYPDRLQMFIEDIEHGEYVMGLEDFIKNIGDLGGLSPRQLDQFAHQLEQACLLAEKDPHGEDMGGGRSFVEVLRRPFRS